MKPTVYYQPSCSACCQEQDAAEQPQGHSVCSPLPGSLALGKGAPVSAPDVAHAPMWGVGLEKVL